jgi:indolepyruvate ferredoxin oxidoreductase beta subunit
MTDVTTQVASLGATLPENTVSVLIAALGGEGGGVLTNWVIAAAQHEGFVVQSTSIPGVAQRTGATTYFVEIYPVPVSELGDRRPILTLLPNPGDIDIMVASELVEAGRAIQNGFITPDRTTLIASTHRVYATIEKMAMGDGRIDTARIIAAAQEMSLAAIMFDMGKSAREAGSVINSVLFGAMAGSGRLPISRETMETVIREGGIAVEANLKGFAIGFDMATTGTPAPEASEPETEFAPGKLDAGALAERVEREYPGPTLAIVTEGVSRLVEYQDAAYAGLFLDRLDTIRELDAANDGAETNFDLTIETARALAHWMAFEDIIRVADVKSRPERFARIRREAGAKAHEPLVVIDYLKPGLEEFCSVLPGFIARPVISWAARRGKLDAWNVGLHLKSTSAFGYLMLRTLARLKGWRRRGHRYASEQAMIERWLAALRPLVAEDKLMALEAVGCARLVKGYGETHRRGTSSLALVLEKVIEPAGQNPALATAADIARAREAALADETGKQLEQVLLEFSPPPPAAAAAE